MIPLQEKSNQMKISMVGKVLKALIYERGAIDIFMARFPVPR